MASDDHDRAKPKWHPKNTCCLIRDLVELMEHPITENETERQLQMLNDFLNASRYAFWLRDIPYIIRLYEALTAKQLDKIPELRQPLECLLDFSRARPMLTKLSEQLEYARDFQEYFSVLGYLIPCFKDLQGLVLNTIKNLLQPDAPVGYCCVGREFCNEAAEKSQLPEILGQLVQVIDDDIYPLVLDLMALMCEISESTRRKIAKGKAIEYLLQRLRPGWREHSMTKLDNPSSKYDVNPHLSDTLFILWHLLNAVEEQDKLKAPTIHALWNLQYAFRCAFICPGNRVNRNNLAAIILKCLDTFPSMKFVESGLADDIAILARRVAGCDAQINVQLSDDQLDFQLKRIIFYIFRYYPVYDTCKIITENELVQCFLNCSFEIKNVDHHCQITKLLLKIIPSMIECSIRSFILLNGNLRIIQAIESYLIKRYDIGLLEAFMCCLYKIMELELDEISLPLSNNNTIRIVLSVCEDILRNSILTSIHQRCLAWGFCILQILQLYVLEITSNIMDLCFEYLDRVIHPREQDPVLNYKITICVVHLLWEYITSTKSSLHQFVKKGGIYIVLDVIQSCDLPVRTVSLGIISDVSQKALSVPYLITWRKRGKRLFSLLMEIFRCSSKHHQCNTFEFSSEKRDNAWKNLCEGQTINLKRCSVSNTDLLISCRTKIYGIIDALKVKFKDKVEVADEHYKLFHQQLSTDDQLTMLFAENYLSLKMCESWVNVATHLNEEGVIPVEKDNSQLNDKIQRIQNWKSYLRYKIENIIRKETLHAQQKELETYTVLKEARLSDALDALKDLRYISNCTERMFQMRKKIMLLQEVSSVANKNSNFHSTMIELPFTNIYNQSVSIQSNIVYDKKEDTMSIFSVSSGEETLDLGPDPEDVLSDVGVEC